MAWEWAWGNGMGSCMTTREKVALGRIRQPRHVVPQGFPPIGPSALRGRENSSVALSRDLPGTAVVQKKLTKASCCCMAAARDMNCSES